VINTKETADFFDVSVPHLRRLYRAGKIPQPIKIGERKNGCQLGILIDHVRSKTQEAASNDNRPAWQPSGISFWIRFWQSTI
jgi:hypothetical protein